jgi:CubicO group peptidase (beta-lactamase class C family)
MNVTAEAAFDATLVDRWIETELAAGRLAGGVLEIRHAGETVLARTFGARDSEGTPVERDTAYWIASMTKPIVSVAALRLIARGAFDLDDPVDKYMAGFGRHGVLRPDGSCVEAVRPPLVRDLMSHLSGLTYGQFGSDAIHEAYMTAGVYDFASDNARMAERLAALPLLHQPGTVFEYGMSTDVLGRVIEIAAHAPLDEALQALVLEPLGMTDTRFIPSPGRLADLPETPTATALAPPFREGQRWFSGGGGLTSTLPDYLRFADMLLGRGQTGGIRMLQPDTFELMTRNHLPAGVEYGAYTAALGITAPWPANGLGFGLGLAVRTERRAPVLPGGVGEFLWPGVSGANFWVDPEHSLVVVFLTHAPEQRAQHRLDLRRAVYAGLGKG